MDPDFHDAHEAFRQRFRALATERQPLHAAWEAAVEAHDLPRQLVLIAREHELLTAVSEVIAAFQAIIPQRPRSALLRRVDRSTEGSRIARGTSRAADGHRPSSNPPNSSGRGLPGAV